MNKKRASNFERLPIKLQYPDVTRVLLVVSTRGEGIEGDPFRSVMYFFEEENLEYLGCIDDWAVREEE